MAQTTAKMHNINLLNIDLIKSEMKKENYSFDNNDNSACIDFIMKKFPEYKIQKLCNNVVGDVSLFLYYYSYKIQSALSKFTTDFVEKEEEILNEKGLIQSSILFLIIKNRIYAVPTGQGFRVISVYIIDKFGLIALSSIDSAFKVTALNSNNMSGKTHSENKVFRQELNYFDVQDIDSIIKGLKGKINNKEIICKLLNIPQSSKKNKLGVIAKDSLQLSSSMNLSALIKSLKIINDLIPDKLENDFIDIKILDRHKDKEEIDKNNATVYDDILNNIEKQEETYLGYDFFNKDVETFLDYDKYKIFYEDNFEEFDDSYDIFSALRNLYKSLNVKDKPYEDKIKFLQKITVIGVDNDDEHNFGALIENLSGEVLSNNKHYFMWYGVYYFVENNYFMRLNKLLEKKLSIFGYDDSLPKWDVLNEDKYNSTLAKSLNGFLIHKCIPDNIEFGDVLKFSKDECYIYHVKDKFNCSMRELDRQVELSMKKLNELTLGNTNFFKDLFKRSQNQIQRNDDNELYKNFNNEEEFIDKMKKVSKFIYKVVINIDGVNSILNSDSNIAKYCLNHILLLSNDYNYEIELCFVKSDKKE